MTIEDDVKKFYDLNRALYVLNTKINGLPELINPVRKYCGKKLLNNFNMAMTNFAIFKSLISNEIEPLEDNIRNYYINEARKLTSERVELSIGFKPYSDVIGEPSGITVNFKTNDKSVQERLNMELGDWIYAINGEYKGFNIKSIR